MRRAVPMIAARITAAILSSLIPAVWACQTAGADPIEVDDSAAEERLVLPVTDQAVPVSMSSSPITQACERFAIALNVAAVNYEDFAYAAAGGGNLVDYRDPTVQQTNVVGRTALREAAGAVLEASRTPGLPSDVADPLRSWSVNAAKLLVTMGLRRGGDALNAAAIRLNGEAEEAQQACARFMSQP